MNVVSTADAVGRMLDLFRSGDEAASEALCREIVVDAPSDPRALLMLGVFEARRSRFDAALGWFERAVEADDAMPGAHLNRANALDALGRYDDAAAGYQRAVDLGFGDAHTLVRMATALERSGALDRSLAALDRALEVDPAFVPALYERIDLLIALGREPETVATLERAREVGADPERLDYAAAALGLAPPLAASPPGYVSELFDGYADGFESHLVGHLRYRVPELLSDQLDRVPIGTGLDVLDAGCGTGLCGPTLRVIAARLDGVDLSPRMLDRARQRGCYDTLHCAELIGFLRARPAAFDLVAAADVLIYIGALDELLAAAWHAVRPGGWLVFSTEESADAPVLLNRSRRFSHSHAHVLAAAAGWALQSAASATLRRERGVDVAGRLYVFRRPMN